MSFGPVRRHISEAQVPQLWSDYTGWVKYGYILEHESDWWKCIQAHERSADKEPGTEGGASYWELKVDLLTPAQIASFPSGASGDDKLVKASELPTITDLVGADTAAAFAGTSGTAPSGSNKFVDNEDIRLKQSITALVDMAEVVPDFSASNNFSLSMLMEVGSSRTLKNPLDSTIGQSGIIYLIQDSSGGLSIVFDTYWKFPNETDPTQNTDANSVSCIVYFVRSATAIDCQYLSNWGRSA